jgi:uncharacterized damage-inducible protein DinB
MNGGAEHFRSLIGYNQWANEHVLKFTEPLTDEQFQKEFAENYGSVGGTLLHILGAQKVWTRRWTGMSVPLDTVERSELSAAFAQSHEQLREFAEMLTDDDWGRVLNYKDSKGNPYRRPMGRLVTHLVNHGTYHRGELSLMLTYFGNSPGDLDYVYYVPDA